MKLKLPFEVLYILWKIQLAGFEAFLVGGAVRDLVIHSLDQNTNQELAPITDFDFTTNAKPEEIQKIFPENFYENEFGTVSVTHRHLLEQLTAENFTLPSKNLDDLLEAHLEEQEPQKIIDLAEATKVHASLLDDTEEEPEEKSETKKKASDPKPFEITTYRSDGQYRDFRRPENVTWGQSINDDLDRRDFSVNAMALQIHQEFLTDLFKQPLTAATEINERAYQLIDPHRGMKDLENRKVVSVGNATKRFQEDALRMLRAVRFAVQLDFEIQEQTFNAILQHHQLLTHVSWERIRDEFFKMLVSPQPKKAIILLDQAKLLDHLLPELLTTKGVEQGGHHNTDVWTHSLDALATCPSLDPVVRFATLLHDIAKPQVYKVINGNITFYNHEIIGSRIASKIAKRFRLSKYDTQRVFILTRYHMFHYQPHNTDASIRRFMRKVGLENIDDILDLREGDRLGSGAKKTSWRLEEMKQRMIEQLNQPMDIGDLAIDGHDLMSDLKMKPGREMGLVLKQLFELVMDYPEKNTKEILLEEAKKIVASGN